MLGFLLGRGELFTEHAINIMSIPVLRVIFLFFYVFCVDCLQVVYIQRVTYFNITWHTIRYNTIYAHNYRRSVIVWYFLFANVSYFTLFVVV